MQISLSLSDRRSGRALSGCSPGSTKKAIEASAALPTIPKELIDQFVEGPMSAEAVNAASVAFKKALIERALGGALSHHLGCPPGSAKIAAMYAR